MHLRHAKAAAGIEILFGVESVNGHCIRWGPDLPRKGKGRGFDAAIVKLLWPLI